VFPRVSLRIALTLCPEKAAPMRVRCRVGLAKPVQVHQPIVMYYAPIAGWRDMALPWGTMGKSAWLLTAGESLVLTNLTTSAARLSSFVCCRWPLLARIHALRRIQTDIWCPKPANDCFRHLALPESAPAARDGAMERFWLGRGNRWRSLSPAAYSFNPGWSTLYLALRLHLFIAQRRDMHNVVPETN